MSAKFTTPLLDPCSPNPCKNGGTCKPWQGKYNCACIPKLEGDNCSDCSAVCRGVECAFDNAFYCKCSTGEMFDPETMTCKDIDKCVDKLIRGKCQGQHETCKNGTCVCEENYVYNEDNICKEKCNCNNNEDCHHLASGKAYCVCKKEYYPTDKGCQKSDKCSTMHPKCDQICEKGECKCKEGFKPDGHSCKLEKKVDSCTDEKKCFPGQCFKSGDEEKCVCPEATHVLENNTCINKCTARKIPQGMCPGNGCKVDTKFGFICNCDGKYKQAKDGMHCENKLMCTEGKKDIECKRKKALCVEVHSIEEGYRCDCLDGYEMFNKTCINKCDIGKYKEPCKKKSALCVLDAAYEPTCKCPPLLDVDTVSGNCVVKAKYSYTGNFVVPSITYSNSPIAYSRRSKRAIGKIDYFKLNKDLDNSLKFVYKDNYKEFIILNCKNENSDFKCEIEMKFEKDPQKDKSLNVIATESTCVPIENTTYCAVYPNLIMKKPEKVIFQETDPCDKNVRNELCGSMTNCKRKKDVPSAYDCVCKKGYARIGHYYPFKDDKSSDIHSCEDINECLKSSICATNSSCFNTPGSYKCFCLPGYTNTTEDTKYPECIGVCEHKYCNYGECKPRGINGFSCQCDDFHTGQFCNVTNSALKESKKTGVEQTAIVGSVLGAVLIAVLIGGYIFYRKNKKGNKDDDEYVRHRERAIKEEKARQGLRQQHDGSERRINQLSLERRGSGDYRQYGESHMIPRAKTGGGRILPEMREDRVINADDIRMSPVPRNGHFSDDERRGQRRFDGEATSHPSLSRSTDQINRNERTRSVVQYKNRGYEEE